VTDGLLIIYVYLKNRINWLHSVAILGRGHVVFMRLRTYPRFCLSCGGSQQQYCRPMRAAIL